MLDCAEGESHLNSLISLFYSNASELGEFKPQVASQCPPIYQLLLNHSAHMTVTVERHHGQPVRVQVLDEMTRGSTYHRKILLQRSQDNKVVQFGIVSINLDCLSSQVCEKVRSGTAPLGRILIDNQVLREVQLCGLWKIRCGPELAKLLAVPEHTITYGRTARILVEGRSGIELLEIVAAEEE